MRWRRGVLLGGVIAGAAATVAVAVPLVATTRPERRSSVRAATPAPTPPPPRPPLRARPKLVEPEAGVIVEPEESVSPEELAESGPPRPEDGISPGAPTDAEVRAMLSAMEREQDRLERALQNGLLPPVPGTGQLNWPVRGTLTSPFGQRWGRLHAGIDIGAGTGTPIRAADSGRVAIAGWVGGYGQMTCIQHTARLSTCYAHQSVIGVRKGSGVHQGDVIGRVGCTGHCYGPHLHFEVRVNGVARNPMGYL